MDQASYHQIEHTSDLGLEASGRTLEELFEVLAAGLFSLMTDLTKVAANDKVPVRLRAASPADLLVAWLSELIFLAETKSLLLADFDVRIAGQGDDWRLLAEAGGERFSPGRHERRSLIKAATYHQLEVKKIADGWTGRVIFDV